MHTCPVVIYLLSDGYNSMNCVHERHMKNEDRNEDRAVGRQHKHEKRNNNKLKDTETCVDDDTITVILPRRSIKPAFEVLFKKGKVVDMKGVHYQFHDNISTTSKHTIRRTKQRSLR